MIAELRAGKSYKKSIAMLFVVSLVSILGTCVLSEMLLPVAAGFYGALLLFENKSRIFSLIIAALGVGMLFIPAAFPPIWGTVSVVCGLLIFLLYRFSFAKSDVAILLTVFVAAAVVLSFVLLAMALKGSYTLAAAGDFYSNLRVELREALVNNASQLAGSMPENMGEINISVEQITAVFDMFVNLLVSVFVIVGFLLSGLALKIFTAVTRRLANTECKIHTWIFKLPSIYAYVYFAVYLLSSFSYGEETFSLVVLNLSGILSTVFMYLGIKAVYGLFASKGRKILGVVIIIGAVLLLGSLAIDLLSVFGGFSTIQENKLLKNGQGSGK